jgi:hypothetical protein
MAKKKKPDAIKRLRGDLRNLGVVEKDIARVRANLKKFLDEVPVRSGPETLKERDKKVLQKILRRR